MTNIIYIDQRQLEDRRMPHMSSFSNYNWDRFLKVKEVNQHANSLYWRKGINNFPFKNTIVDKWGFGMPDYDLTFNLDFASITNQRACDLAKTKNDKPWLILYSGGIDSTTIVVALLKNLSKNDLTNITIACNQLSIAENPRFFYDYIEPNFTTIDSTNLIFGSELLKKYYIFDGEPADQLYGLGVRTLAEDGGKIATKDFRQDPDELLKIFGRQMDKETAIWYYESIRANIESTDVPLSSYYDFVWWMNFNFMWPSIVLRSMHIFQTRSNSSSTKEYLDNFIPWYNTQDYQLWAMNNHLGVRYGITMAQRKLASKKYIYEFNQDEYYFNFKLKTTSIGREFTRKDPWFALTNNDERLYLDTDLDLILELLPDHINYNT
jgi:hypothetical protein